VGSWFEEAGDGAAIGQFVISVREPRTDVEGLLAGADYELAYGIGFRPVALGGSGGGGFCFGEAGPANNVVDEVVVGFRGKMLYFIYHTACPPEESCDVS
jgi:hypothetical protein